MNLANAVRNIFGRDQLSRFVDLISAPEMTLHHRIGDFDVRLAAAREETGWFVEAGAARTFNWRPAPDGSYADGDFRPIVARRGPVKNPFALMAEVYAEAADYARMASD